jgi:hypothetical protein
VFLGLLRSASTDAVAAGMLREVLREGPLLALARAADETDPELRALLVGTQVVGLAMARHIIQVEPLASTPREVIERAIAPTIQRYLRGDIGTGAATSGSPREGVGEGSAGQPGRRPA